MASVNDLEAKVDNLTSKVEQAKSRILEDVDAQKELISDLRAQVEAGQVDQATVEAIAQNLDSLAETVDAIDPDPDNPPPQDTGSGSGGVDPGTPAV